MDLQRRLSLHPNVVRFMGACCHIPNTGRPFQDDTLDNWQVCSTAASSHAIASTTYMLSCAAYSKLHAVNACHEPGIHVIPGVRIDNGKVC